MPGSGNPTDPAFASLLAIAESMAWISSEVAATWLLDGSLPRYSLPSMLPPHGGFPNEQSARIGWRGNPLDGPGLTKMRPVHATGVMHEECR